MLQEFQHAARGMLKGSDALDRRSGVHMDVRRHNACWASPTVKTVVALVDISICATAGCQPSMRFTEWSAETLDEKGRYQHHSDMRQAAEVLEQLCENNAAWQSNSAELRQQMTSKQLTAREAFQRSFLKVV